MRRPVKQTTVETKETTKGYLYQFDRWGPEFWRVMHAITFLYPDEPTDEDKGRILTFFRLVPFLLPCSLCGMHFVTAITDEFPITTDVLSSRDKLTRWLVDLHNGVNTRIDKQVVQYDRVKHFYTKDATCPLRRSEIPIDETAPYRISLIVLSVLLLLVIVASGVIIYRIRKGQRQA